MPPVVTLRTKTVYMVYLWPLPAWVTTPPSSASSVSPPSTSFEAVMTTEMESSSIMLGTPTACKAKEE
ncbi:uncharacterized protein IUM83_08351 [Phytophthora cinnamomi]|uniref:uncharacterized protein n=1 Tax=Phytophthora cinnamomi TaxID=4785 RepID=UPI00355AAA24|nr:hypothetical protein IUM83_08351 [Phytophthora cinnamomi]